MSGAELADLEALIERVLPDPGGFAKRVFQQAIERLDRVPGFATPAADGFDTEAYNALVEHNLLLAGALGACECWGGNLACEKCRGCGGPGWEAPVPELFREFVAPALTWVSNNSTPAHATHKQESAEGEGS
jgi:hypothetical protein